MSSVRAAVAMAALLALLSCTSPQPAATPLRIGIIGLAQAGPIHVAEDLGYFREERLAVELRPFVSGRAALLALLAGDVEVAMSAETPVAMAVTRRQDVCVLTTLGHSDGFAGIVARRDRGIGSVADLPGKRVAVPRGTNADYFLHAALLLHGVAADRVAITDLGPLESLQALREGRVDAIAGWQPHLGVARAELGEQAFGYFNDWFYHNAFLLSSRPELVRTRGPELVAALRAIRRAVTWMRSDPEASARLLRGHLPLRPHPADGGFDLNDFDMTLDQGLVENLATQGHWAVAQGPDPTAPAPDFLDHVCSGPLRAVDPRAVALAHGARE